jgi:hypothetical protein
LRRGKDLRNVNEHVRHLWKKARVDKSGPSFFGRNLVLAIRTPASTEGRGTAARKSTCTAVCH